jgi:hypothetical protein
MRCQITCFEIRAASNKSMDVRRKQRPSYKRRLLTLNLTLAVSAHVISIVRHLAVCQPITRNRAADKFTFRLPVSADGAGLAVNRVIMTIAITTVARFALVGFATKANFSVAGNPRVANAARINLLFHK